MRVNPTGERRRLRRRQPRPQRPSIPQTAAGARALPGRNADRQSRRHHVARARGAARRRPHLLRRHSGHRKAAGKVRDLDTARGLSRPQCRAGATRHSGGAAARRARGAGIGCRHAARLRSRLQARAGGDCRRSAGHRHSRARRGADRADPFGAASGRLPVRRLSAAAAGGAAARARALGRGRGDPGVF